MATDFLSSLIARNLPALAANLPLVRPRLRAHFEPTSLASRPLDDWTVEPPAAASGAPPAAARGAPDHPPAVGSPAMLASSSPAQVRGRSSALVAPRTTSPRHVAPPADPDARRVAPVHAQQQPASVSPRAPAAQPPEPGAHRVVPPLASIADDRQPGTVGLPEARSAGPADHLPARPRSTRIQSPDERLTPAVAPSAPLADAPAPPPEPPSIHITIGRVEVCAAAPAPVRAPRPAVREVTLEDYLRRGGRS